MDIVVGLMIGWDIAVVVGIIIALIVLAFTR